MSLGINNTDETYTLEVKLMDNEVLRVTQDGQFIWHPDADRLIEEGNFSFSPAMPHLLRALRKREWVGLTDEDVYPLANKYLHYQIEDYLSSGVYNLARAIEAKLKERNT